MKLKGTVVHDLFLFLFLGSLTGFSLVVVLFQLYFCKQRWASSVSLPLPTKISLQFQQSTVAIPAAKTHLLKKFTIFVNLNYTN
jgi:hypothetical protein